MAVRTPALAKLTRPKLFDALPRPRLYALLDEAATRPIVWVCAPPGAGKTTLVASWLEARDLRHVWYQVDGGDADSATIVHYMRLAAMQVAGKAATSLPLFNSEPQQNLARFTRSFFREFFSLLPHPTALVFDNFHEARTSTEQRAALAQGLDEIPDGVTFIAISRTDPPPEFARHVANRRIARFDAAELRCTSQEAEAILGARRFEGGDLERIQRQSDGWVAAVVLLREHLSRHGATIEESLGEGKDAIFQYFASEIFNGASAENQRTLMLTAIAPSITSSEAVALSGSEDAPRLLEYLYRRHLFTDRRRGHETSYHYHALFREFLLDEMRRRLSRAEWRTASARAGELLAERGESSAALALLRDAGEWDHMRTLICAHALDWARQGRAQVLSDWIESLPATMRASDPWLAYWLGRAWIFVEPQRGRPALERAYDAFHASADLRGQALALNTIVTSYYYEWANFAPLDRWLPEFERLLGDDQVERLDRESELRARAAYLIALLFRRPDDEKLARCAQRLDRLIDDEDDVNIRVMAASTLFNYINWNTDGEAAAGLVERIAPVIGGADVTPLMQVWWRTHLSFWHYRNGRYDEATAVMAAARAIAERYGLDAYLFEIDHAEAIALISKGEYTAAKALVKAMERRLSPARRMDWAYFHHLRSQLEHHMSELTLAVQDAERAVALGRETGLPILQMPQFLARLGHARLAAGDRDGGLHTLDEAIALASPAERKSLEQQRELVEIEHLVDTGSTREAADRLGAVLADYRTRGQLVFMRNRPRVAARLALFALEHRIESDYVQKLIERNALVPPDDAGSAWPFRLRIRALGGFEIVRDGQPMRFAGKAQQRPLDLLKLLIASGGKDVDSAQVMALLWPDADGAAAKTSFDTTLHRLRKLIDVDNTPALAGGKLSLSRTLAWSDVWAFEAACEVARRASESDGVEASLAPAARRLLDAYPGPLLGAEEHAWIIAPRDALRARFVRTLLRLGERLERSSDWTSAIDLYRRGVEADNLAESIYRGLMRALAANGDLAEALVAFRRCRELLSIVLGVKPGAETERLYREINSRTRPGTADR